jgi:hypothetical protein
MRIRRLTKRAVTVTALINLPLNWLFAQTAPQTEDEPIDVEPPLLVKPWEPDRASDETDEDAPESELDAGKLAQRLEAAKKDAEAANRLVKKGVLAKVEAEQRALRVLRLQSDLAKAQMLAAEEQVVAGKSRLAARQATQAEVDLAVKAFVQAEAAAKTAEDNYHKAQLENASLNVSRQRKLFSLGSARKADVTRAEDKLAKLQQTDPSR